MPPGAVCVQQLGAHGLDAAQDLLLVTHHGDAQTPNIPGEEGHCQKTHRLAPQFLTACTPHDLSPVSPPRAMGILPGEGEAVIPHGTAS